MTDPLARPWHPTYRTGLGASDVDYIWLLGHDLAADLLGKVTFGELAYWMVAKRRPTAGQRVAVRGGARRPRRPRVHADGDRRSRHVPQRTRFDPGCDRRRPARRRLALPRRHRELGQLPPRRDRRPRSSSRPTTTGWDEVAAAVVAEHEGGGPVRPRARSPGAQAGRPAHAGAVPARTRATRCSDRTSRCSRRSAGCTPTVLGQHVAAQRRRRVRRGARRHRPAARRRRGASPCSPAVPACSATSPRRWSIRSATTST